MLIALFIGLVIGSGTGWLLHRKRGYASLHWWESYRLNQLHEQAEQLRNGPLQDLFGLRRHLELLLSTHNLSDAAAGKQLLSQLKVTCEQLEQCSDRLSSPFDLATDSTSLPLALKAILQAKGDSGDSSASNPAVRVNLNFPQQWQHKASLGSLLLPTVVEQLTQRYCENQPGEMEPPLIEIEAQLLSKSAQAQFHLQLTPPLEPRLMSSDDAMQLRQAFQHLSGGSCQVHRSDGVETWSFQWS